ncbi:hypothetical protein [Sphaerisporangium perillae]|uniref:hypothetical protein n=1 Tax=Sphaerisporangium perillae TaxID=2935860 RepID=UPI00200E315C|nr:hypothetical protein [Sphaerisporangium perillae]
MSGEPMLSKAEAKAETRTLGEQCPPAAQDGLGPGEPPLLYARVLSLCRLLGEERFFRAAFGHAGVRPREAAADGTTRVLELDVDEVLRAALGQTEAASLTAPAEPGTLSGR